MVLANGAVVTIFHDLVGDGWFLQTGATPIEQDEPVDVAVPAAPGPVARRAAAKPLRRAAGAS